MSSVMDWNEEQPLPKITCTSHDCDRDLHSFLRVRPGKESYRSEKCRACGAALVHWDRLDRRDLGDVAHTVECLNKELIRHRYWHVKIDEKAMNHATRKGTGGLREAAEHRLRKYVAAPRAKLFRDGSQTPLSGNVIFYGQHATATCCRKCIEAWHGIERNRALTDSEIDYMTALVMLYVEQRLPDLKAEGTRVPRKTS